MTTPKPSRNKQDVNEAEDDAIGRRRDAIRTRKELQRQRPPLQRGGR
jgi:hypothetical protein